MYFIDDCRQQTDYFYDQINAEFDEIVPTST